MIKDDFRVDFEKKLISYNSKSSSEYEAIELYSFIQDLLDDPDNMQYDVPIKAITKTEFRLANGWSIDKEALNHIKRGTISH